MKKLLVVMLIVGFAGVAFADSKNATFVLATQERATGAGGAQDVRYAFSEWGCDAIPFGNMSAYSIRIEGNQGGAVFDPQGMATHTRTFATHSSQFNAGISSFIVNTTPVKRIRPYIISQSGGADPRLTIRCTGRD